MRYRNTTHSTLKAPWTRTPTGRRALNKNASGSILERPKGRLNARIEQSDALRELMKLYVIEARAFVKDCQRRGLRCPVVAAVEELRNGRRFGHPISDKIRETHHVFGRGPRPKFELLLWKPGWQGVSKMGHRWIHAHPKEARKLHLCAPEGLWNNPKKVFALYNAIMSDERTMDRMLHLCGFRSEHAKAYQDKKKRVNK